MSINTYATNLDSLIQVNIHCDILTDCYENHRKICIAAAGVDQVIFEEYLPQMLRYMHLIDNDKVSIEGYQSIAESYLKFNLFNKADSSYLIAKKFCTTNKQKFNIDLRRVYLLQRTGHINKAMQLIDMLFNQERDHKYPDLLSELYLIRGVCYLDNQDISQAIPDFLKVKELTKDKPNKKAQYDKAEDYLTKTYTELKSYESALKIYKENRDIRHAEGDHISELFSYFDILYALHRLEDYEQVIQEGHRAIELKNEHKVSTAFGFIYYCMSESFFEINQIDSALYYADMGISLSRSTNEQKELVDNLSSKAKILLLRKDYVGAKLLLDEAIAIRDYDDENLLKSYSIAQAHLGNYKDAYLALKTNWTNWEESESAEESHKIATLLAEERLKMQHSQQIAKFENVRKSDRMIITIVLLSFLICVIGGYLYIQMKNTTKLETLNQSLRHHNQALEQFAHITSHDLKEPVRNISSFASLLMRKSKADKFDDDEREYIKFIKDNSTNLYRMIESIRKFTEVSFSNQQSETIEVKEVFEVVRQNLRRLIYENNTVLEFHNPKSIEYVQFPKDLLIVTLQNLVQNGIKYNQSKTPKIEVTISESVEQTIFKISDNGIGIDKEFHAQIFVPFKTLENKVNTQSSGLGLSICKNILENHGGNIWVESDGSNGSSFYFSI